jgi:hypothetical protein
VDEIKRLDGITGFDGMYIPVQYRYSAVFANAKLRSRKGGGGSEVENIITGEPKRGEL